MEEKEETLEERFQEIEEVQKEEIEKLRKDLKERDNLIKKYMTQPTTKQSNIEDKEEADEYSFNEKDVQNILDYIKRKRS